MIKLLVFGVSLGLAMVSSTAVHATDHRESTLLVSIDAKQLALRDVLNEASRQIGWTIVVDERLVDKNVSGSFEDISLESFLRRSLKGEAIIVLYDKAAKSIDIRSFGAPKAMVTISPNPDPDNSEDEKKIQAVWVEEQRDYEAYVSNPDSVDPLTGMKLSEIAALQEKEEKEYQRYLADPNSVDPLTGTKLSDISGMQKKEKKEYERYISDPNSIDPLTDMKLSDITAMREKEKKATEQEILKSDSVGH